MSIGIFGGSFDPPHICHVLVCQYVLAMSEVERILVIPSSKHPFDKGQTSFEHRLAMTQLAMQSLGARVEVSAIESQREGYSYTIDTVRALREIYPGESFRLIIGTDILGETDRWKEFDEVARLAPVLVVPRDAADHPAKGIFAFPALSSTRVREALVRGEDVSAAIVPEVLGYIREKGLY